MPDVLVVANRTAASLVDTGAEDIDYLISIVGAYQSPKERVTVVSMAQKSFSIEEE